MPRLNEIDYLAQIASNTGAGGSSSSFYDPRGSSSSITSFSSTTNAVIKEANANRKLLTIYNDGPGVLLIAFSSSAATTTNYSVKIAAGDFLEVDKYTGALNGYFLSINSSARVTELS